MRWNRLVNSILESDLLAALDNNEAIRVVIAALHSASIKASQPAEIDRGEKSKAASNVSA